MRAHLLHLLRPGRLSSLVLAACACLALSGCEEDTIEPILFGAITGEVYEVDGATPIARVQISTNPGTSAVLTDDEGRFELTDVPAGTYSLRAEFDGYATQVASATVLGDATSNVIIRLPVDSTLNAAPSAPTLVAPADGATAVSTAPVLRWRSTDPDADDVLRYTVTLYDADRTGRETVVADLADTTFQLADLAFNTTYFWQVAVSDGVNDPVLSDIRGFTTRPLPDYRFLFARDTDGKYDVYAADGLGAELQLTDNAAGNWRPRMNPQRDRIAYISNLGVAPQLYVMDRDGRNAEQVTTVPISGANPLTLDFAWSPDGTRLLYPAGTRLYTIRPDGTGLTEFARAPAGFTFAECDWTDQGDFVAARIEGADPYTSFIVTLDLAGTILDYVFVDVLGATGGPRLSVDGDDILFTQDASGFEAPSQRQLDARIYVKDLQTSTLLDLSAEKRNGTNDLDPVYSPDGAEVLFVNTNNDGISRRDIYRMDVDGTDRELLFENAEMPEWR